MKIIEVCASSVESILEAKKGGAQRIELCDNLPSGGTTPPLSWIELSCQTSDLQTFVLIRPREGDYLYTESEFQTMKRDIQHCGEAGCQGVVIGILTEDGKVDMPRSKELVDLAKSYNMQVTFHRAIDRAVDIIEAMENIIALGCDRILTSGGYPTAMEGKDKLKEMVKLADGRVIILPASGINEDNAAPLAEYLGVKEVHGSFRTTRNSKMKYQTSAVASIKEEYTSQVSSAEKIKIALERLNKL